MSIPDISNIPRNGKAYGGTTKKFGVTIKGKDYIVKFPKGDDMSVYCEYIASRLIRKIGVSCHRVCIGLYNGTVVDIIEDFTSGRNISLHSYKDTKQSSEDTDIGDKNYTYKDVLYLLDKHLKMAQKDRQDAKAMFWDMFICDAIIGNRDRHHGNWGYISNGTRYKFAPLYDNGGGLFPGVNKAIEQYKDENTRKKFMYERIYIFPASLFLIEGKDGIKRSNYAKMFEDLRISKIFAARVRKIKQEVTPIKMFEYIRGIVETTDLGYWYKRFFVEIVVMRYMCIVLRKRFDTSYSAVERWINQNAQK